MSKTLSKLNAPLPKSLEQDVAFLNARGDSIFAIARMFGRSEEVIQEILARQGDTPRVKHKRRTFSDDYVEALVTRWEFGTTPRELAKILGEDPRRIRQLLREAGCDIPTRNRKVESPTGSASPSWRGGRTTVSGNHVGVYVEEDDEMRIMADRHGYVREGRLAMARSKGRPLLPSESVHHLDGNKRNNDLSNLELRNEWSCPACGSHNLTLKQL